MQVSSNTTLFFKVFAPVLWLSFFAAMTLAYWMGEHLPSLIPMVPHGYFKYVALAIFIVSLVFIYFTFFRISRVEMYREHFTTNNYWNTQRVYWKNVEGIKSFNFGLFKLVTIKLKKGGKMGDTVRFLPSKARFRLYLQGHPEVEKLVKR